MTTQLTQVAGTSGLKLLDFPVAKAPIFLALGKEIPGQKAIVRPDNGQVLGILSDSYKLVSYKEQYEPYLEKLDREGWKVNSVRLERAGARAYVELDHTSDRSVEVKKGDAIGSRLILGGSYDGSTAITSEFGVRVLWCTNGATRLERLSRVSIRHVGDPQGRIDEDALRFGGELSGVANLYRGLADTAVSKEIAAAVIREVCGQKKLDLVTAHYTAGHGPDGNVGNAWGVYNAITKYLTFDFGGQLALREQKNHEALDILTHPEKIAQIIEAQRQQKAGQN